jgi:hypothetical protein
VPTGTGEKKKKLSHGLNTDQTQRGQAATTEQERIGTNRTPMKHKGPRSLCQFILVILFILSKKSRDRMNRIARMKWHRPCGRGAFSCRPRAALLQ